MRYGIPYVGSKSRVAGQIIDALPSGGRFVDLFCGGCAMTHAAMLSGKYKTFLANDFNGEMPKMFLDAINGKFADETRWISREDFFRLRDEDAVVRTCWSFGNGLHTYMYGRHLEKYKRACHFAVVFDDWTPFSELCPETAEAAKKALDGLPNTTWKERKQRRLKFGPSIVAEVKRQLASGGMTWEQLESNPLYKSIKRRQTKGTKPDYTYLDNLVNLQSLQSLERLESLQSLESLESLERLERLESLERLQSLEISSLSYEQYEHREGDVVYCDPPYSGTTRTYGMKFDNEAFWEWVRTRDWPVYVSEYSAPDDFVPIWQKELTVLATPYVVKRKKAVENLFVHRRFAPQ